MTRNLKALGLALVAVMALGAIGAQGASAAESHSFNSGDNSTILTGSIDPSTGDHLFYPEPGGSPVTCSVATFSGTTSDSSEVDTVTVHPKYNSCDFGGIETDVNTDGCNYIFDSDTTQATSHSTSSEHAATSIECESTHQITVNITGVCILHFSDESSSSAVNQSLHGVRYTNLNSHGSSSKKAITVNATVNTIHYTATSGSFCGLGGISAGTHTTGEYTGKASVTGFTHSTGTGGSVTTGTTWSHGSQVDVFLSTPA